MNNENKLKYIIGDINYMTKYYLIFRREREEEAEIVVEAEDKGTAQNEGYRLLKTSFRYTMEWKDIGWNRVSCVYSETNKPNRARKRIPPK